MSGKKFWLIAFVDMDPPSTHGGAIVRAAGALQACEKVGRLGLHPPDLAMYPVGEWAGQKPKANQVDVALTDEELEGLRKP